MTPRSQMTLRRRFTLAVAGAVAAVALAITAVAFIVVRADLQNQVKHELRQQAAVVERLARHYHGHIPAGWVPRDSGGFGASSAYAQVVTARDAVLGAGRRRRAAARDRGRGAGRGRPARLLLRRGHYQWRPRHGPHHPGRARPGRAASRAAQRGRHGAGPHRGHPGPAQRRRRRPRRAGRLGRGPGRPRAGGPASRGGRAGHRDRGSRPPGRGGPRRRARAARGLVQHHARRAAAVAGRPAAAGQRRQPRAADPADQPAHQLRAAGRRPRPAGGRTPGDTRPGRGPGRRAQPACRRRHRTGPGRRAQSPGGLHPPGPRWHLPRGLHPPGPPW